MNHKGILSSEFNMSLGFIPVVISLFLCEITTQDMAIYIGTGIGIIGIFLTHRQNRIRIPNYIMYLSTTVLMLISISTLIPGNYVPIGSLPLTLEASILIPLLILYLHKKKIIHHFLENIEKSNQKNSSKGIEATIVSARFALILGSIHFIAISIFIIVQGTPDHTSKYVLYNLLPQGVFLTSILLNQIAIHFFNHLINHTEFVPIVNIKGDVLGKIPTIEVENYKSTYMYPVIRIAIFTNGMLFLCNRPSSIIQDQNKLDIPMEGFLRYGETLTEGAMRLVHEFFPHEKNMKPTFNILYHYKDKEINRLIYLFIIDLKDDYLLSSPQLKNSKLWNCQQIEANLGKDLFSHCFEEEYEHLKSIIYIREKYKES